MDCTSQPDALTGTSEEEETRVLVPLYWLETMILFGGAGLVLLATTRTVLPALVDSAVRPRLAWFAASGPVFVALLLVAVLMLRAESSSWSARQLLSRLRLKRPTLRDLRFVGVALGISVVGFGIPILFGVAPTPDFLTLQPLNASSYYVLLWWLPLFVANIFGEELLWRGVMLPRNEIAYGQRAWLVNGTGWLLFHVAFGVKMILILAPMMYATVWVCQRTRSTTVGLLVHGAINGVGFLALALGAM